MKRSDLIAQNVVASEGTTIEEAMRMMTDNQRGAIVVVDDEFVYKGIVSDGDVRRGLVRGATQFAPVSKIVNVNARVLQEKEKEKAEELFKEQAAITLIPVVGEGNTLVDVMVRDKHLRKD